jgi:hypothetical protein
MYNLAVGILSVSKILPPSARQFIQKTPTLNPDSRIMGDRVSINCKFLCNNGIARLSWSL